MGEINTQTISQIRQLANIVDIISEFVVLKRMGKDYRGLCPFHNEKSPSFYVNNEKGIYKCFGCGEGGDVFSFLQKVQAKSFIEIVTDLAGRFGIQVEQSANNSDTQLIYKICQTAKTFYQEQLQNPSTGKSTLEYLQSRGISIASSTKFELGFAPNGYDNLLNYLTKYLKVSPIDIEKAGLIKQKNGKFYDLFRNRLIIPIINEFGKTIAFGGRALDDNPVKYLNSPETAIFTKGQNLFGLNLAKEFIVKNDFAILVEGYLDVIMAHQFGFGQTVASLGTALTSRQAKLLFKFSRNKKILLSFDNDKAGLSALDRGIELINDIVEGVGADLRILQIAGDKDIADYFSECVNNESLRHSKTESFNQQITNAPNYLDFLLNKKIENLDISQTQQKISACQNIVPILASIRSPIIKSEYIKNWSNKLNISENDLNVELKQYSKSNNSGIKSITIANHNSNINKNKVIKNFYRNSELTILAIILANFEKRDEMIPLYNNDIMLSEDLKKVIKVFAKFITKAKTSDEFFNLLLEDIDIIEDKLNSQIVDIWYLSNELTKQNVDYFQVILDNTKKIITERIRQSLPELMNQLNNNKNAQQIQSNIAQLKKMETSDLKFANDINNLIEINEKVKNMLSFNYQVEL